VECTILIRVEGHFLLHWTHQPNFIF